MVIHKYTNTDGLPTPKVDDVAADCEAGTKAVKKVFDRLMDTEVKVAKRDNQRGQLSGDLEIDEHGIRREYVSKTNPYYQKYITPELRKGNHKYTAPVIICFHRSRFEVLSS